MPDIPNIHIAYRGHLLTCVSVTVPQHCSFNPSQNLLHDMRPCFYQILGNRLLIDKNKFYSCKKYEMLS